MTSLCVPFALVYCRNYTKALGPPASGWVKFKKKKKKKEIITKNLRAIPLTARWPPTLRQPREFFFQTPGAPLAPGFESARLSINAVITLAPHAIVSPLLWTPPLRGPTLIWNVARGVAYRLWNRRLPRPLQTGSDRRADSGQPPPLPHQWT